MALLLSTHHFSTATAYPYYKPRANYSSKTYPSGSVTRGWIYKIQAEMHHGFLNGQIMMVRKWSVFRKARVAPESPFSLWEKGWG
jgi:hypothetical protein